MVVERTIVLRGFDKGHHDEGVAGSAISPGMGIEMAADGEFDPIAATQAESLKRNSLWIAKEDMLQGKTIDDAYAIGDIVFMYKPLPGDKLLLLTKSGANIAVADKVVEEGGGSGLFVEAAGTETRYRAIAKESSGGALAANDHLKYEWF